MKNEKEHIYSGIATFMRSPYVNLDELQDYDVAVLGVPIDHGVSYRAGQQHAPRAIREYSFWDRVAGGSIFDFSTETTMKCNNLAIGDLGDVPIWTGDAEKTNEAVIRTIERIRSTSFPLVIGGDHSITYATFIGCKRALERSNQLPLGLLHFDAHVDTEESCKTLPRIHHGNMLGQLIREGHLAGDHVVSIGTRGYETAEWVTFAEQSGVRRYTVSEIRARTLSTVFEEVVEFLKAKCRAVYVTFDMDCVDPTQAPGVGTPVFEGLLVQDLMPIIRQLSELPVVSFDLVELCPPLDPSGITTVIACEILWQFLAFGLASSRCSTS